MLFAAFSEGVLIMTSSNNRARLHRATDADIAKVVDGPAVADYKSSDMAHAVDEAQHKHGTDIGREARVPLAPVDRTSK